MTSRAQSEQVSVENVVALPERAQPAAVRRPTRTKQVARAALAAVVLGLSLKWWIGRGTEFTDDARLETHVSPISARIAGQVRAVRVSDDQIVEAGAVVLELDDRELLTQRAAKQAEVAEAHALLSAAQTQHALVRRQSQASLMQARGELLRQQYSHSEVKALIEQKSANFSRSREQLALAARELVRLQKLMAQGAQSQSVLDAKQSESDQAQAAMRMAEADLMAVRAARSGGRAGISAARGGVLAADTEQEQERIAEANVEVARARLAQAEAAHALAELNVEHALVRAPVRGVVSKLTVEVGQQVAVGRPLLALVALDDTWVVANFKERDLSELREGQSATVQLDVYGGSTFKAHVSSIGAASGARFSLLPADNASGNFIKIEQRVPVVVRFDKPPKLRLPAGLNAEVTIHTMQK